MSIGTLCIIGSGPLAIDIAEAATLQGWNFAGVWSDPPTDDKALKFMGRGDDLMASLAQWRKARFICAVQGVERKAAIEKWSQHVTWTSVVHPHSCISVSATIGEGTFIAAGVIVCAGMKLEAHTIVREGLVMRRIDNLANSVPHRE